MGIFFFLSNDFNATHVSLADRPIQVVHSRSRFIRLMSLSTRLAFRSLLNQCDLIEPVPHTMSQEKRSQVKDGLISGSLNLTDTLIFDRHDTVPYAF